ncbi:MAG: hypothetical protein F7C07_00490 [Desulfurococcales archaeon]|nr:hypothetical protein [Desulfurococcales archaeon]
MPRVDPGWWLVEYGIIERSGASRRVLEWGLSSRALLVTSPSIVTVELEGRRVSIVAGIGSLVSRERPPFDALRIVATEWVDACQIGGEPSSYRILGSGTTRTVEGVARAYTLKSIIGLFINGTRGRFQVYDYKLEGGEYPLVVVEEAPIVVAGPGGVASLTRSEQIMEKLDYIVPLATSCGKV